MYEQLIDVVDINNYLLVICLLRTWTQVQPSAFGEFASYQSLPTVGMMAKKSFSILIIGAGIAGLAAAVALTEKGHKVTILEAAPKVRIKQTKTNVAHHH